MVFLNNVERLLVGMVFPGILLRALINGQLGLLICQKKVVLFMACQDGFSFSFYVGKVVDR